MPAILAIFAFIFVSSFGYAGESLHDLKTTLHAQGFSASAIEKISRNLTQRFCKIPSSKEAKAMVAWARAQGVNDVEKFFSTSTSVFNFRIKEDLEPKVAWLKEHGVKDVPKLLTIFPAVLQYSIDKNLVPKLDLFINHWGFSLEQVVATKPMLLGAALSRLTELTNGLETFGYNVHTLSVAKRLRILYALTIENVLANLREGKMISSEVLPIAQLSDRDFETIQLAARYGLLERFLVRSTGSAEKCKKMLTEADISVESGD